MTDVKKSKITMIAEVGCHSRCVPTQEQITEVTPEYGRTQRVGMEPLVEVDVSGQEPTSQGSPR